jgi:glyoxylase-like metal-dependent hydrolase (beta-lactamase superfamily II)
VAFLGDAAKNEQGLVLSPIYEDRAEGVKSLCRLGDEEFETVCFAHGDAIVGGGPERLRQEWSE